MVAGGGSGGNHSSRHYMDNQPSLPSMRPVFWNQVVRGESEKIAASPSMPLKVATVAATRTTLTAVDSGSPSCSCPFKVTDHSFSAAAESSDGNAGKKPVWNKRSNGVSTEIEPVMGWNANWPALSKSSKSSTNSSSSTDLLVNVLADGSSVSDSVSQETVSVPSFPQGHDGDNTSTSHVEEPINKLSRRNDSPKEHTQRSGQSHNVNNHPHQQRNSFRNRNSGPNQHGDGSYHHTIGGRRDHDRGNPERNNRNLNGRNNHLHPRGGPKFVRPVPPPNSGFFIPPPVQSFGGPMAFPMVYYAAPPHDPLSSVPFVSPLSPPPMFFHPQDPLLLSKIVNQVDYYFSNENLVKDIYLRRNMDDQGWVHADLIAHFNKVMQLTQNILNVPLILEAVRTSSVLEVQGDKIRRRNDWNRWLIPPNVDFPKAIPPQTNEKSNVEVLAEQVGRIELGRTNSQNNADNQVDGLAETCNMQTTFVVQNSQLQLSGGEAAGN